MVYSPYSGGFGPYGGSYGASSPTGTVSNDPAVGPGSGGVANSSVGEYTMTQGGYNPSSGLQRTIALAQQMIGGRYVLGAQNASSRTFDCSGLVQWAYGQNGYNLPRLASQQRAATAKVSVNNLSPGDLVFTSDGSKGPGVATHVMIYIGNGQVVNAQSEGKGIRIASMSEKWIKDGIAAMGSGAYGRPVLGVNTPQVAAAVQPKITAAGGSGSTGNSVWNSSTDPDVKAMQDQWRSAAALAQKQLDEQIRQFDVQIGLEKDKFKQQQLVDERNYLLDQRNQYIQLGTTLLSTAASLSGPRDWLKYAQYTNGGQSLFSQLFGSTAAPAFGAATGYSAPNDIQNLLAQLGIGAGNVPQNPNLAQQPGLNPAGLLGGTGTTAPNTVAPQINVPATTVAPYTVKAGDTLGRLAAQFGTTVAELAKINGISNPNLIRVGQKLTLPSKAPVPTPVNPNALTPLPNETPLAGTAPSTTPPAGIPQPHQINVAVWDSLSPSAKQMILGAYEGGLGTGGYMSGEDALAAIEKARPKGQVNPTSTVNWSQEQRW